MLLCPKSSWRALISVFPYWYIKVAAVCLNLCTEYLEVSSKNVHAYILGEHGDSSLVPWEHCYVGCKKIIDIMKDNNHPMEDLKKIHDGVWQAAYEIIEKKNNLFS